MNLVLDANLIASLAIPLPYSVAATAQILTWKRQGITLAGPSLWSYEVNTVLRKAVVAGYLPADQLDYALSQIRRINVQAVSATLDLHRLAQVWAEKLGQSKTYDSAYLAVAESLQADFWTADRRLARAAQQAGATWVYSIFEN
jgi:predicted nucleic acid-binding protein